MVDLMPALFGGYDMSYNNYFVSRLGVRRLHGGARNTERGDEELLSNV